MSSDDERKEDEEPWRTFEFKLYPAEDNPNYRFEFWNLLELFDRDTYLLPPRHVRVTIFGQNGRVIDRFWAAQTEIDIDPARVSWREQDTVSRSIYVIIRDAAGRRRYEHEFSADYYYADQKKPDDSSQSGLMDAFDPSDELEADDETSIVLRVPSGVVVQDNYTDWRNDIDFWYSIFETSYDRNEDPHSILFEAFLTKPEKEAPAAVRREVQRTEQEMRHSFGPTMVDPKQGTLMGQVDPSAPLPPPMVLGLDLPLMSEYLQGRMAVYQNWRSEYAQKEAELKERIRKILANPSLAQQQERYWDDVVETHYTNLVEIQKDAMLQGAGMQLSDDQLRENARETVESLVAQERKEQSELNPWEQSLVQNDPELFQELVRERLQDQMESGMAVQDLREAQSYALLLMSMYRTVGDPEEASRKRPGSPAPAGQQPAQQRRRRRSPSPRPTGAEGKREFDDVAAAMRLVATAALRVEKGHVTRATARLRSFFTKQN